MKTGRNDPCPCGSGRKYKHCCLALAAPPAETDAIAAQRKADEWLRSRIGKAQRQDALEDYFDKVIEAWDADEAEAGAIEDFVAGLPEMEANLLGVDVSDWLLLEAQYEWRGATVRGVDLVLSANDTHLSPAQRACLEALARAPLLLVEVVAVEPGKGLHLRNVLQLDLPVQFVHEVGAARFLHAGHLLGARVIDEDGHLTLGGALYPLSAVSVLSLFDDIDTGVDGIDGDATEIPAGWIRDRWFNERLPDGQMWALPRKRPPFHEDRYDVIDVGALHRRLDEQEGVASFQRSGLWMCVGDHIERMHVVQHPGAETLTPDHSQLLSRGDTETNADASRAWIESVAGEAIRHRERAFVQPPDEDACRLPLPPTEATMDAAERSAELAASYANWCDEALGALGDQSPREALGDPRGRYRVELLLQTYDLVETALAANHAREPVSFDFLRIQLGLPTTRTQT
jgi:hypothetical protein